MYRDTKRRVTLRHFIGFLQIFAFFVKIFAKKFGGKEKMSTFAIPNEKNGSPNAEIAQLVEHNLAKVGVASSSLVFRSKTKEVSRNADLLFETKSTDLIELRLTNIHPTGFHYMSVVLVHKVGFFVFIPRCKIPSADNVLPLNTLSVYACFKR